MPLPLEKAFGMSAHETRVHEVLGAVYRRNGESFEAVDNRTPLDSLLAEEEQMDSQEQFIRVETFRKLLGYVFAEGPDPARSMRRLYALGKSYTPELLFNISDQEIAMIFGETRAAVSWRRDKLVTKKLEAAGARGTHVRCQKTEGARLKYAKAQMGNRNRAKGKKK